MLNFDGIELDDETKEKITSQFSSLLEKEVGGLKSKVDDLLKEKKTVQQKAEEAEANALKVAEEAARKGGDIESLDKSWHEKMSKVESDYKAQIDNLMGTVRQDKVDTVAVRLAAELGGENADGLLPHIERRLDVELSDGKYKTIVKDASGNRSAQTLDELKAELINTPFIAPLIITSQAGGAGGGGSKQNAGGAGTKSWSEMTAKEKAQSLNK